MFSFSSQALLTQQVTVYDKIIGLETYPKYYPAGSSTPIGPQGPLSNLLPLQNNVTFFFNLTQGMSVKSMVINLHSKYTLHIVGTVQTLKFYQLKNGANVSINNVTLPEGTDLRNFSVNILFNDVSTKLQEFANLK